MGLFDKIFGTHSEHELKRIYPIVDKIEGMREDMVALSDEELRAKTDEYKKRLADGETLDDLLPESFATVREAARPCAWHGTFPCAVDRWCHPAPGTYC